MSSILHLRKRLISLPTALEMPGVAIRPFNGTDPTIADADARAWLGLREASFAGMTAGGRPWSLDDFHREFAAKPWWKPERMLMAVGVVDGHKELLGSATLGRTGRPPDDEAALMWLMVLPAQRRRGLGHALLGAIERLALEAGETTLMLETHASWNEAVRLYRKAGYEQATDQPVASNSSTTGLVPSPSQSAAQRFRSRRGRGIG